MASASSSLPAQPSVSPSCRGLDIDARRRDQDASNILLAVGNCSDFASASHLAAYAGIAPLTRLSGTSIKGELPARSGNKRFKNALFRSAWIASNRHSPSRAYYQRKRAEGKHNAAVMCLARRRSNVIYAVLTNREFFREPTATPAAPAAA